MKIIQVHNSYKEHGGEDVVVDQERRMLELAGHTVVRYSRSNHEIGNLTVLRQIEVAKQTVWSSDTRSEFYDLLAKEEPDVVHVHNTFTLISPSVYTACSDWGVAVVQTLHNFRLLCPASSLFRDQHVCEECVEHSLWRAIRHGCYRNSRTATATVVLMLAWHRHFKTFDTAVNCYIAPTNFARGKFIAAGFPAEKIAVKPHFVESDPGPQERSGDYALFVGRLSAEKGVATLLEAWKQLPRGCQLQVVGEGGERQAMEATAQQHGLNILFRGHLSREEVIKVMKRARILIVPSLCYETFGLVIVEAFACGVPVICSRLGGMDEIVQDQLTGTHFTPADPRDLAQAAERAWNNPAKVSIMGRAARVQYEKRYTADRNYEVLRQIYEQAVLSEERSKLVLGLKRTIAVVPKSPDAVQETSPLA